MINRSVAALAALMLAAGCAARGGVARPVGAATDDPTAVAALEAVTAHCRPLRTATAEIRLSGRAGSERIRARLLAGFAAPASVRLEALAPFGGPAVILASDGTTTTLYFPRDRQVLRDASVADVLDAMTGLGLEAGELRRLLFGCAIERGGRGRAWGSEWQSVEEGDAQVFLRRGVQVAADVRGWQIDYEMPQGQIARQVRVRRTSPAGAIDLTATLGEVATNVDLDARAFTLDVPPEAEAITIDDLRRASPLAPK